MTDTPSISQRLSDGPLDPQTRRVVANFLRPDGTLHTIPSKHAKLRAVLDHLAQSFELGRTYPEREVNDLLQRFHPDHAALRRYLVEEGFLTREESVYWRTGGTVDL